MRDFVKILLIAAGVGVLLFVVLAAQLTTVEHPDPSAVDMRFRAALKQFEDPTPLLRLDTAGHAVRERGGSTALVPAAPVDIVVLHWGGPKVGLVETRIPIWFLGLKGPALRYMLRDTSFDPHKWGITVSDIRAADAGVVIAHRGGDGTRTLVWSE